MLLPPAVSGSCKRRMFSKEGGEEYAPEGYVVLPIPAELIKGSRAQQNQSQSQEEGEEDKKLIKFQRPKAGISRAEQFARNCRVQDRDRLAFEEEAALQKVLKKKYPGAKFAPVSQMAEKEEPVKQYTAKGKGKKGTSNSMMMSDGDGKETKKNREDEEEEEQSAGLGLGDFQKPKQKKKNGSGPGKKEKSSSSSMSLGGEDEDEDADEEEAIKPVVVKAKPSIEIRGKRKMTAPAVVELDDGEEEDQMDSSDNNNNKSRVVFVAPPTDGKSSEGIAEWDLPDPDMLAGFRRTEGKDMAERMNKYSDNFREKTVAELRKQLEKAKEKKAQMQLQQQQPVSMVQEQQQSSSSSGNASQSQGGSSMDETS